MSPLKDFRKTGPWLRFSIEAWDKLCLGEATTSFIYASYLFEKQASKEIVGRWYPLCSSKYMGVAHFIIKEGTGGLFVTTEGNIRSRSQGYLARQGQDSIHESWAQVSAHALSLWSP